MMKKYLFIFLALFCCNVFLFSEVDYEDSFVGYTHFFLSDDIALYENLAGLGVGDYTFSESIKITGYQLIYDHKIPFIEDSGERIFLILANDELCYLYHKDAINNGVHRPIIIGLNSTIGNDVYLSSPRGILDASSHLIEGDTEFVIKNIRSTYLDKPWVEGAVGQGIGEEILIELRMNIRENPNSLANGLFFFNGYVSYEKPYLYEYNSRVKKLKILDIDTDENWYVDIEDTPVPQYIDFTGHEGHTLKLIIEEVYPGSQWEDTCVNTILLAFKEHPYDNDK